MFQCCIHLAGASACNDAGDPIASSGETVQPTREERKTVETAETQATSDPRLRGMSFMFK